MKPSTKINTIFPSRLPRLSVIALACQLACLGISTAHAQSKEPSDTNEKFSTNQVTIKGKKVGMGLMVQENAPKARSTITADELEKQRPTGNAYEALELMPAVNSYNQDATGLFGGGLTLRGFNSDQIGATINGVPVNDSGSFAVYPQEYVDQENTCTQFVTQGSTDVDSPQIGATGGNFGIVTCDPQKEKRVRLAQTLGMLNVSRTYVRYDTGILEGTRTRFFISGSHSEGDKWKGEGRANRNHVDMGFRTDFDRFNTISGTVLYNKAVNQNISTFSLADLAKYGYEYDYARSFVGHAAATPGKAGSDTNSAFADAYYQLTKNPFENAIASITAKFRIADNTDIKIIPYFWYGYGTGGNQQRLQTESAFLNKATGKNTAGVDLNGDGDTLDKVIVANSSVTRTNRPGVTASVLHTIGDHQILGGFWFERSTHDQFGPMVKVDAAGNANDIWLKEGRVLRPDGTPYQSRDWRTISTSSQVFLQDTINLMKDKLAINVGVRVPTMNRDFTNHANEGNNSGVDYHLEKTYTEILPQLGARYQIDNDNQVFFSLARNMKAPPNFVYSATNNVVLVNGQPTMPVDVKAETSVNIDLGYRIQNDFITAQATAYTVDFSDRQATAYDPVANISSLTSVGKVKTYGFELEMGNTPVNGFSFYGSIGYANSEIQSDIQVSKTASLPTKGKSMTLTPEWKAGLSAMYEQGGMYARVKVKYTGEQWATMTNDERVPSYTLVGLDMGYKFADIGWIKKPKLSFNISNLTNRQYRNPSSFNVTNAKAYGTAGARTVFYYMGAPRYASVTLRGDF